MMGVVENGASSHVRLAHTIVSCSYITCKSLLYSRFFENNRIRCYKLLKKGCKTVLNISMLSYQV